MSLRWPWTVRTFPWVAAAVTLGLALRSYHYLRNPSMWHDEAALVVNVLDKDFGQLLGPLLFSEAAPPLFLWVERAVTLVFGDSTYALRLVPYLASCGALLLIVPLARRLLPPAAVPWPVFFFACSDQLLWHNCEAKPYAVDVFVATALAWLFCRTAGQRLEGRLLLFAALAPFLIFLAYPGCFLFGGLLVALLPAVWRERRGTAWLAYGVLTVAVFAAFALLLTGPIRAQRDPTILADWRRSFPDYDHPWGIPLWTFLSTLEVFRYCLEPMGQALAPLAIVGAVALWRRGGQAVVLFLVIPIFLPLAASFARAYPFAGARILVYASPALALLVAAGIPVALDWLRPRSRFAAVAVVLLALSPSGRVFQRMAVPWQRADCAAAAEYVLAHREPDEAVRANHWEYVYYFRTLGAAFRPMWLDEPPPDNRLWVVVTDDSPQDRLRIAEKYLPGDWLTLERQEFAKSSVFLIQPLGPTASQPDGPPAPPHSRP
jgi:hypothetical protein